MENWTKKKISTFLVELHLDYVLEVLLVDGSEIYISFLVIEVEFLYNET